MSETKFKVGDWVRVIATDSGMFQKVGVVKGINEYKPLPYNVETKRKRFNGWFRADELEPAPTVNECSKPDNVNHPPHYNQGGIECIDAIKAATGSGFVKYCTGNVIKYLWRYDNKGGLEDLKKAAWYLDRAIKEMEVSGE
jgi:hypothetical protein